MDPAQAGFFAPEKFQMTFSCSSDEKHTHADQQFCELRREKYCAFSGLYGRQECKCMILRNSLRTAHSTPQQGCHGTAIAEL